MNRIAVIGAGFSGISVCYHLIKNGIIPVVFDAGLPEKASSVPLGLINPATGQKALPAWHYQQGLQASFQFLEELQTFSKAMLFAKNGVVRPAMTLSMSESFKKNAELFNTDVVFLDSDSFAREFPSVFSSYGGLVITNAGTVSGSTIHQAFSSYARHHHIEIHHEKIESISATNQHCLIQTNEKCLEFDSVVVCTGSVIPLIHHIDIHALIHPVKGQLTRLQVLDPKRLPAQSISGLGYLARLKDDFVFGSTFEHHFNHLSPTEEGAKRLQEQLNKLIPKASDFIKFTRQWIGVRASTPDRKPLIGTFDAYPTLSFYLGNGSKGMLWSLYLGDLVVKQILQNHPIESEVDIRRFNSKVNFN
jgi:glycine/D-amino acid oxidase-like deaminating enzyme